MTQNCRPAKCIEAIRVTLLDQCSLLVDAGPLNGYAMGCIIDPNWTPEIEEGEESIVKDNCGNICLQDVRCDQIKHWNLDFKIKNPDPEFEALISGNPLITSEGQSIGVRYIDRACSPYLFVEMFEKTDGCAGDPVYLRHVFPAARLTWTGNEKEGIFRLLQIEGKTKAVTTDDIGTGPYNDIPVGALVGVDGEEGIQYAWFEDTFVPDIQCGAIAVPSVDDLEPTITTTTSPSCDRIEFEGTNFDVVNHIVLNGPGTPPEYYNPNGPDAALNPATSVVTWTDTHIVIVDTDAVTGFAGETVTTVHAYGIGDVPDYGVLNIVDQAVAAC